jgi:hypothetical protein
VAVDAVRELPQMRDRGVGAEIELIEHAGAFCESRSNTGPRKRSVRLTVAE